jgi:hypothetical protein
VVISKRDQTKDKGNMKKTKTKKEESKVLKIKTYTITVTEYEDRRSIMNRRNDGFNPFELLGFTELISGEIREQIKGVIKPDIIKRESVID